MARKIVAAVEGGGTSFVVAVAEIIVNSGDDDDAANNTNANTNNKINILERAEIDSSHDDPHRTLEECSKFFRNYCGSNSNNDDDVRLQQIDALGVAMFGPFGVDPNVKETYGTILPSTPKKSWRNINVLSPLVDACSFSSSDNSKKKLLVKIDTDVNAPAVAEYISEKEKEKKQEKKMNEKCISSLAYVTIGTGVGVGLVIHGKPVHGRMHPEGGHVPVIPLDGDTFTGYSWGEKSSNPFMGVQTVESMASSIALSERLEQKQLRQIHEKGMIEDEVKEGRQRMSITRADLPSIDDDDDVWDHASNAVANLCVTLALVTSVEKIVLGGGIMNRKGLLNKIRKRFVTLLNGYLGELSMKDDVEQWITTSSSYGNDVGLIGAFTLAQQAIIEEEEEEKDDDEEDTKDNGDHNNTMIKRTAYKAGVWHGLLLGLSATYVGILLYARSGRIGTSTSTNRDGRR